MKNALKENKFILVLKSIFCINNELFPLQFCSLPIAVLLMAFSYGLQADNPELDFQEWWTSDELHLMISLEGNMPNPNQNQATYFLNFKNTWVMEMEGIINSRLKQHSLQVGSVTAGESNKATEHHLSLHIILKQVSKEKRHKLCNVMAFIYTTNSDTKDLKKACTDKINKELIAFTKEWKVENFFFAEVENADGTHTHRARWHGVIGIK